MTTKRVKQTVEPIDTREEMEACVQRIAEGTIHRDGLMVELDAEITEIRARYEPQITAYGQEIAAQLDRAQDWAMANPDVFGSKRSLEMVHGLVGFRIGMPRLKPVKGATWVSVLVKLTQFGLGKYIRETREPDKQAMIADRETIAAKLPALGLAVVQDETFFVEPKREEAAE